MNAWLRRLGVWSWAVEIRDAIRRCIVPSHRREERVRRRQLWEFVRSYASSLRQPLGTTTPGAERVLIGSVGFIEGVPIELALVKGFEAAGYEPTIVASDDPWMRRYYRAAGIRRVGRWRGRQAPVTVAQAMAALERVTSFEALLALTWEGIRVGRFTASTALRRLRVGSLEVETWEGRRRLAPFLAEAMTAAAAAQRLIQRLHPALVLLVDKGYTPQGQLFDACLSAGIPVLTWNIGHQSNSVVFKRYRRENRDDHPISLSASSWDRLRCMPWTDTHRARLHRELRDGYASGEWYSEVGTQFNTRLMEPDELRRRLGLDPAKKTAVIFPHILWDGTFFFGRDLFRSYEEWFVETVRAACANDRVNWVIKIHPANLVKNARDGVIGEPAEVAAVRRALGPLPKHLALIPADSDISTFSLFGLMDACVTVRGTVGLEAASFGIPVLTAGTGRYDRRGFTVDAETREEFLRLLGRIEELPPLSDEQRTLAERFAYGIFVLRPLPLVSVTFHNERDRTASLRTRIHPMTQADWLNAPDLSALARWVCESNEADWLMSSEGLAELSPEPLAALAATGRVAEPQEKPCS